MFGFRLYALYHEYFILRDQHLYRVFKLSWNAKIFAGITVLADLCIYWDCMTSALVLFCLLIFARIGQQDFVCNKIGIAAVSP